ncbi:hypothetical protein MTO96_042866 [Rhipicephalus appendiculatus]
MAAVALVFRKKGSCRSATLGKTSFRGRNPQLEDTLAYFVREARARSLPVTVDTIRNKAVELARAAALTREEFRAPNSLDTLESRRRQQRREKLRLLGHTNALRCAACPTYGRDLVEAVTVVHDTRPVVRSPWGGTGYVACLNAPSQGETQLWRYTRTLRSMVRTPPQLLDELRDMIDRFVFAVPKVTAPRIEMRVSHPSPSSINAERVLEERLRDELGPRCAFLHPVMCNLQTQFPELRLIQYDCGKKAFIIASSKFWTSSCGNCGGGQHRVLIFTQMTRMLDVLEQFLNYHGHTYLRLDGSTRVDQRQALMERFNADRRIFCFILSTRSGESA